MKITAVCSAIALALSVVMGAGASNANAGEVVINGSTTVLPIMQKAGEAYMKANPKTHLVISGGGSGNGIKALCDGLCQVAMSSRDIKSSEKKIADEKKVSPVRTTIALDCLVPVVHPSNKVRSLTMDQLRNIYTGKVTNWKEVGGADAAIIVVSRDTSSGTFECWNEMVMKKERVNPRALTQASNGTVVQTVAGNKNAIGYIGLGYLNKNLAAVSVDGKTASAESALQGTWPIARELYLFTNGQPKDEVKSLIDYMLAADKGQKMVKEAGYVPLGK